MSDDWEPYSRKTFRIAMLLDVAGDTEQEAFGRINLIARMLADRDEDKSLTQVGYECRSARSHIMGANFYVDQLRQCVGPAPAAPLPSMGELLESAIPSVYRQHPGQLAFVDTGYSSEVEAGRGSAAD